MTLITPTYNPVQCGFCPNWITPETEVNGRLYLVKGVPMCAVCRVTKGKLAKVINRDYANASHENARFRDQLKRDERNRIEDIAERSQQNNAKIGNDITERRKFQL